MISTGTLCETPLSARTWRWVVGTVLCLRMPLPGWCALVLLSASNLFLSLVLSMVCVRRCVVTHLAHSWLLARESLNDDASLAPLHSPPPLFFCPQFDSLYYSMLKHRNSLRALRGAAQAYLALEDQRKAAAAAAEAAAAEGAEASVWAPVNTVCVFVLWFTIWTPS
jgi:hypothetical protein